MTECNAIIKANNEIDKLKKENKKLNESCVQYGFDMGELREENEQLKQTIEEMIKIFNDSGLDYVLSDEMEEILNDL